MAWLVLGASLIGCSTVTRDSVRGKHAAARALASRAQSTTEASGYYRGDDDADTDDNQMGREGDGVDTAEFGKRASTLDSAEITAVVGRYYAAAAAGDASRACSLLYSGLARGARLGELAESYGPPPDAPLLRGKSCPYIMSLLFAAAHRQLAISDMSVKVVGVHVKGVRGMALVAFRTTAERYMPVEREGRGWKVDSLFDRALP